ncbi:C2H2-type domain-containing protein [Mycena chlorophos]|uniref:C2H2-type domain-containing protein n=1 Tax=Mycena chlorophos TaxID=658473 RepID=A0A8H6RUT3_MYCCL|nr:C2H2-type domain-containing protein [Mycena chlorophos]
MSASAKRQQLLEEVPSEQPSNPYVPAELSLQLQNIGRRVRMSVSQGYATQRRSSSVPPSPTHSTAIFTSNADVLRDVFGSAAPTQPAPESPRKRQRESEEISDSEDTSMPVDNLGELPRPIKPKPRRLMQTQSLPSNLFGPQSIAEEDDWSIEPPRAS